MDRQQTKDLVMSSAALSLSDEYRNPSLECRDAIFVVFCIDIPVVLGINIACSVVTETCLSLQECGSTSQLTLLHVWHQITNPGIYVATGMWLCSIHLYAFYSKFSDTGTCIINEYCITVPVKLSNSSRIVNEEQPKSATFRWLTSYVFVRRCNF